MMLYCALAQVAGFTHPKHFNSDGRNTQIANIKAHTCVDNEAILSSQQPIEVTEEHQLLDSILAGDDSAYITLVERYHSLMVAVAGAIVGDTHAEDVAQDAWISAHRALAGFERRSRVKTWLLRIVSNEALTRAKREARQVSLNEPDSLPDYLSPERFRPNGHWQVAPAVWHSETPETLLEETQLHSCLTHHINNLPKKQQLAFRLRDIEQQSFEDIGDILGVSYSNARVLVHRARLTLMGVIDHYQETGQC